MAGAATRPAIPVGITTDRVVAIARLAPALGLDIGAGTVLSIGAG